MRSTLYFSYNLLMSNNPTTHQIHHYLTVDNGWSTLEVVEFFIHHKQYINDDNTTTVTREMWTFLASGHNTPDVIIDKVIWSAAKGWFQENNPTVKWEHLTSTERDDMRLAYIDTWS